MTSNAYTRAIDLLLEEPLPWPATLDDKTHYQRQHDDTDGRLDGVLGVAFGPDGDAYVSYDAEPWLRFRTSAGGGMSLRVHAALLVLAEAIRRDNAERPQRIHLSPRS